MPRETLPVLASLRIKNKNAAKKKKKKEEKRKGKKTKSLYSFKQMLTSQVLPN